MANQKRQPLSPKAVAERKGKYAKAAIPDLSTPQPAVDKDWAKKLYSPARTRAYMQGQLSGAEYHAITWYEMLDIANKAFSFFNEGKYKESGVLFQGLISLDPYEAYYRLGLGAVYLAEDQLEWAKTMFDQAVELNANELAAYVNRGECYLRMGQILDAALDFQKVLELDPQGKDPLTHRARVLAAAALETIEGQK